VTAQQILVNALGGKCSKCGSTERLEVHHIDGNHENNIISNTTVLCKKCHSKTRKRRTYTTTKEKVSVSLDSDTITWLDEQAKKGKYRNRSHVIEFAINELRYKEA
jgi:5-methylcytosine-specific restriction endonuclease McrA